MSKALLLIDVQDHWAENNPKTTEAIRQILPSIRREMLVVWTFVHGDAHKHPHQMSGTMIGSSFRQAMRLPIIPGPKDVVLLKREQDAFSNPNLAVFFNQRNVLHVINAGFMGYQCVLQTVEGALRNGFKASVAVPLTADYRDCFHLTQFGHEDDVERLDKKALKKLCKQNLTLQS